MIEDEPECNEDRRLQRRSTDGPCTFRSPHGCCTDGITARKDVTGAGCPVARAPEEATPLAVTVGPSTPLNCGATLLGCCTDGATTRADAYGSNCADYAAPACDQCETMVRHLNAILLQCFGQSQAIPTIICSTLNGVPSPIVPMGCASTASALSALVHDFRGPFGTSPEITCVFGGFLYVEADCNGATASLNFLVEQYTLGSRSVCDALVGCSLGRWLYAVDDCDDIADSLNLMLETWISTGGTQCVLTTPTTTTPTTTDYMPGFSIVVTTTFTSFTGGWKDLYWLIKVMQEYSCMSIAGETRINVAQLGTFVFPAASAQGRGVVQPPAIGGCGGTQHGCCDDGSTSKMDAAGSNCPGASFYPCFDNTVEIDLSVIEFPGPISLIISSGTLDCAGVAVILSAMIAEVVGPNFPIPEIGCGLAGQFVIYSWGGGEVIVDVFIYWLNFIVDCFQQHRPARQQT